MYFRVNLKMKNLTLCYCFTWTVFIELNFTVAFLLKTKTLLVRWGLGILRNGGDPSNGGMILKWWS